MGRNLRPEESISSEGSESTSIAAGILGIPGKLGGAGNSGK